MKRKIKKAIAVCLMITSIIAPITAPGEDEYVTSCDGCGYSNTGRLVYSEPIKWGGRDENYHWDTEDVFFRCTNTEYPCPYYSTNPHFKKLYPNREIFGTKEPHQILAKATPFKTYTSYRQKGSSHDVISNKQYYCVCSKVMTQSIVVQSNVKHSCISHIYNSKKRQQTHVCACGATRVGPAHF